MDHSETRPELNCLKKKIRECGLYWARSGWDSVVKCLERDNEPSCLIESGSFFIR